MRKLTRLSEQWFYDLLDRGECDIVDFKERLEDRQMFGKAFKNFAPNYEELARDVVAFANAKGGFLFVGVVDGTKEVNAEFVYDQQKIFALISQIQNRTTPSITLTPHKLRVQGVDLLVLEIPFSNQLHRTSRGEFLVRCNNDNRAIDPCEMATIQAEKGLIVFDRKVWDWAHEPVEGVPSWIDMRRIAEYKSLLAAVNANNPRIQQDWSELCDGLGWMEEVDGRFLPTTTGLLFAGTDKALRMLPYSQVKYIRYFEDGTYRQYEYSGNIVAIAQRCYAQLKSEIQQREFHFDLLHEYAEDYSEVVLRELLINALAHRDYSRQQIVEIRKYPTYLEFESPGRFPEGITVDNYLVKTNARNPAIMDSLREIRYAEKAGSGFDKIFTALLSKGKNLPMPEETDSSVIFRVEGAVVSEKLMQLAAQYRKQVGYDPTVDQLLVLRQLANGKAVAFSQIESAPFVSKYRLRQTLQGLCDKEFIEPTGRTSGLKYILHVGLRKTVSEKIEYAKARKQTKAKNIESILRYLDAVPDINNAEAREILKLPEKAIATVSKLFSELCKRGEIEMVEATASTKMRRYRRVKK